MPFAATRPFVLRCLGERMVLDLRGAFECEGFRRDFTFAFDMSGSSKGFSEPVRVVGAVRNQAGVVALSACAEADYDTECDRCCIPFREHYSVPIRYVLVRGSGGAEEESGENDDILPVAEEKLDVAELAAANVLLALPMKHLCREDCKGLCPRCGKNLNEGPCGCDAARDGQL